MLGRSKKNIGGLAQRRRRRLWIWFGATFGVLVIAAAAGAAIVRPWTPEFRHGGLTIADPPAPVRPFPQVSPAPAAAPAPSPAGVVAALGPALDSPDLGAFAGVITDAESGTTLWSKDSDKVMIPSSTLKLLTTAAALIALPDDQRVATTVVEGSAPGELVLVGGGDPTLTAQPDGKGYYPDAACLSDLVDQIRASGRAVDTIVVDLSAYTGPSMARGWEDIDIPGGSIAPIDAVMIDGGRLDPLVEYSPRTPTPGLDAGRRLAADLGLDPARVRAGTAAPGAAQVAKVESAPLHTRLHAMLVHSDNVLAETVGREIALATGHAPSFSGAVAAVTATLERAGFAMDGTVMHDTSGLSVDDRLSARLLNEILATAARPAPDARTVPAGTDARPAADDLAATLAPMLDNLPVAGATGSLTSRYVTQNRVGAGWVRAKTGTLSVSSTLAGYVLDRDGRVLTFALMSNDRPPEVSRPALDAIAGTLRNCGCS
ncbi:D-alanyl-D-alanine carboxypeptidase/D-alanyl-D-alanine-endopeptidase [Nocardia puris]|uniref:D-alanyl-D-alanine carboxypeptidase/D-alanyl-D-alanine-endopeptidase (Penicillin-binding protein 4) n=1 Tax=Nocardia puris TaxID=208602 RepID=A0A366DBB5_9NOCA|nr:D-alanyl-D-alanine carboxypeptidase [Nocardia puris]RBO87341.1 D-alanyl-D-alanine carboxypeptidase/D-alanyl-D-alanine-endopeptidase (penicillin-binding protein 4) [Nocardia puris]